MTAFPAGAEETADDDRDPVLEHARRLHNVRHGPYPFEDCRHRACRRALEALTEGEPGDD